MEKRKLIKNTVCIIAILSCLIVSSCGGSNTYTDYYTEPSTTTTAVTTTTTTTKPKETIERTYTLSDSEAKSIAKKCITKSYTDDSVFTPITDRVYFGDVKILTSMAEKNYVYVSVSGHYYKKDKYGNSGSKTNFTKTIKINCETKKASFY